MVHLKKATTVSSVLKWCEKSLKNTFIVHSYRRHNVRYTYRKRKDMKLAVNLPCRIMCHQFARTSHKHCRRHS